MAAIPTLENRIVNIKQTTADGVVSIQEAELRHIDVHRDENSTPIRIIVVLAKAWGVQLNMPWNISKGKFIQLFYPAVGMELVLGQGAREASVHLSD